MTLKEAKDKIAQNHSCFGLGGGSYKNWKEMENVSQLSAL